MGSEGWWEREGSGFAGIRPREEGNIQWTCQEFGERRPGDGRFGRQSADSQRTRRGITRSRKQTGPDAIRSPPWLIHAPVTPFPVHACRTRTFAVASLVEWSELPRLRSDFECEDTY